MRSRRWLLFSVALAGLLLTSFGCPFITKPGDHSDKESPFKPRTSPENLLMNLRAAYLERDPVQFDSLLAKDFTFEVSEWSVQEENLEPSWGREEEMRIHHHMFEGTSIQQLTLEFDIGPRKDPDEGEEGDVVIEIHNVTMYLHAFIEGEEIQKRVNGDMSRFLFRKNGWTDPATGDSIWTIVRWKDIHVTGK